jgi:RimJ/RimL family protein N-acetyltransferase
VNYPNNHRIKKGISFVWPSSTQIGQMMDIKFQRASLEHESLLREWRNDEETRANSISKNIVDVDSHHGWLVQALRTKELALFIAFLDDSSIGTIRVEQRDGVAELSWTVAPAFRKQGVGSAMLCQFVAQARGTFIAKIFPKNLNSKRIAEKAGFRLQEFRDGVEIWRLPGDDPCKLSDDA